MKYVTFSRGISRNPQISSILTSPVHWAGVPWHKTRSEDVLLGWGHKANTLKARALASKIGCDYWRLEDGFVSFLGHPSYDNQRLSLICDRSGIYYDSRQQSDLDLLLQDLKWFTPAEEQRATRALAQTKKLSVSKYNHPRDRPPKWLIELKEAQTPITLVVDQTAGDASLEGAQATEQDFRRMLDWAVSCAKSERGKVIIKVHPDVLLGKKSGHFTDTSLPENVIVLADDISPSDLFERVTRVCTVSSQVGFEALWYKKEVHCFGISFYAQRGLTVDHLTDQQGCIKRKSVSLEALFCAAIIHYPKYWHPDKHCNTQFESILDWLQAQLIARKLATDHLDVINLSPWKRTFIAQFVGCSAKKINYEPCSLGCNTELHWGMKSNPVISSKLWRMEDGFIRSVGLGADLRRPSSLVIDDIGIYYNGKAPSRLEQLLSEYVLNEYEIDRASRLIQQLSNQKITKYNVERDNLEIIELIRHNKGERTAVLVAGQFQDDLSIKYGTQDIKSNLDLINQARMDYPDAYIVYKEHPDVYSGVRPGKLKEKDVLAFADEYVTNISIISLFSICERLCTMSSLSGFEALLRGVAVSTYGIPFYAGWGLTDDRVSLSRRNRPLNLYELAYISLVLYPRYVNWCRRSLTTPEIIIEQLNDQRDNLNTIKSSYLHRQSRKLQYLWEAFSRR